MEISDLVWKIQIWALYIYIYTYIGIFRYRMKTTGLVFVKTQNWKTNRPTLENQLNHWTLPFSVSATLWINSIEGQNVGLDQGLNNPTWSWDLDIFSSSYLFSINILKIINKLYAKSFADVLTSCANSDFTPHPCNAFNSVANSSCKFQHLVVQLKQAHQEGNHCTYFSSKIRNNYSDSLVLYLDPPNFIVNQLLADA